MGKGTPLSSCKYLPLLETVSGNAAWAEELREEPPPPPPQAKSPRVVPRTDNTKTGTRRNALERNM